VNVEQHIIRDEKRAPIEIVGSWSDKRLKELETENARGCAERSLISGTLAKCPRNIGKRGLFSIAYIYAAETEETTLSGCLCHLLANTAK
jgi:hypothetical protein